MERICQWSREMNACKSLGQNCQGMNSQAQLHAETLSLAAVTAIGAWSGIVASKDHRGAKDST